MLKKFNYEGPNGIRMNVAFTWLLISKFVWPVFIIFYVHPLVWWVQEKWHGNEKHHTENTRKQPRDFD
jgi:hypothetical protein